MRSISVEFPSTLAGRPMSTAVATRPAADTATARVMKMTTSQTPRLTATLVPSHGVKSPLLRIDHRTHDGKNAWPVNG